MSDEPNTNDASDPALELADDRAWMAEAIAEAQAAADHADVPVGAIVVARAAPGQDAASGTAPPFRIIGRGHNRREIDADPTAHAEVLAIRDAARSLGTWHLVDATLYVTQEPCPMCAGALVNARLRRLVYGCDNPKAGAIKSLYQIASDPRLNHRVTLQGGVRAEECGRLLSEFFKRLRSAESGISGS